MAKRDKKNLYSEIIEWVFLEKRSGEESQIAFERDDLLRAVEALKVERPKNLGDVVYSFRYRYDLPDSILETQPDKMEWIIEGAGSAKYIFKLVKENRILPNPNLIALFELTLEDEMVKVVEEKHYRLVPSSNISEEDLNTYAHRTA